MNKKYKVLFNSIITASLLFGFNQVTQAKDNWPNKKPITVIVPYTPGGATDIMTRVFMDKLSQRLDHNIIIENKPGANGTIGNTQAARAKPDGYTFLSILAAYAVNFSLYDLKYTNNDFEPVSQLAEFPLFLFFNKDIPVENNDLKGFVEYAKKIL